jgi:hypothetical protein
MSLEDKIKDWVILDNKYIKVSEEMKKIRDEKNEISSDIITFFNEKEIKNPTINITGGKINLINQKLANPLSYKFLEDCFKEFFNNDEKAKELLTFIKEKRIYSENETLKRINLVK